MSRYALGIDGGGSKCDAVLMDASGAVLAWGRGGPTHIYYDPAEVISASYLQAIAAALAGVQQAELWVAGPLPDGAPRDAVRARSRLAEHLPVPEEDAAFASAQEQSGLIVLAGTGSFVHGRTPHGRNLHLGGQGPILGDHGSAYAIGLLGLRAAFASHWTQARRTTLAAAIPHALGVPGLRPVFDLVYLRGLGRRHIAALAKTIDTEAESGDTIAISCLQRAADELADLALDAITELQMQALAFPLIGVGGVARHSRIWWQRVCLRLSQAAPAIRPTIPAVLPAVGAALLALRQMGVAWTQSLLSHATETALRAMRQAD